MNRNINALANRLANELPINGIIPENDMVIRIRNNRLRNEEDFNVAQRLTNELREIVNRRNYNECNRIGYDGRYYIVNNEIQNNEMNNVENAYEVNHNGIGNNEIVNIENAHEENYNRERVVNNINQMQDVINNNDGNNNNEEVVIVNNENNINENNLIDSIREMIDWISNLNFNRINNFLDFVDIVFNLFIKYKSNEAINNVTAYFTPFSVFIIIVASICSAAITYEIMRYIFKRILNYVLPPISLPFPRTRGIRLPARRIPWYRIPWHIFRRFRNLFR